MESGTLELWQSYNVESNNGKTLMSVWFQNKEYVVVAGKSSDVIYITPL